MWAVASRPSKCGMTRASFRQVSSGARSMKRAKLTKQEKVRQERIRRATLREASRGALVERLVKHQAGKGTHPQIGTAPRNKSALPVRPPRIYTEGAQLRSLVPGLAAYRTAEEARKAIDE